MQSPPSVRLTFNRLPSWKRNTPAPATSWKINLVGPEQVLDGCGEAVLALTLRNVNGPSVPFPAKFSSAVCCVGLLQIDRAGRSSSRKRHLYGHLLCVDACDTEIEHQRHGCYVFHLCLLLSGGDHDETLFSFAGTGGSGPQNRPRFCVYFLMPTGERAIHRRTLGRNHESIESLGQR